ncbi:hypothetical protein GCM10023189_38050 [Nibrella saemangeumensis]|uniref:Uncharacterized protein n=1 Tax=Nibrella saemangeumensis TaxID=1084526 RepID=A0ABP8N618_9BACT
MKIYSLYAEEETPAGTCHQLILELIRTFQILNAPQPVLATVAAFSDAMPDAEVLAMIRDWNDANELDARTDS